MRKKEAEPVIEFKDYGFVYYCEDFTRLFAWKRVTEIVAFKVDLISIDDIRLQICDDDGCIVLTEDYSFFEEFNNSMLEALPGIDKNWYGKITLPAFAANTTILFKKTESAQNDLANAL